MCRGLCALLVVAMVGLTGFGTYSWLNCECSDTDSAGVSGKKSCCTQSATAPTKCCSETGDTAACDGGECPSSAAAKKSCCEGGKCGKEGACVEEKPATEEKPAAEAPKKD